MINNKEPIDGRSTYRKRARKVLEREGRPYWCGSSSNPDVEINEHGCGRSPTVEDAPGVGYDPTMNKSALQVNHINKNISDNDPANLEYLCPSCHKIVDSKTEKGVSILGDEHGYGLDLLKNENV